MQSDAIAISQFGELGLRARGIENPLLAYAKANDILAPQLTLTEGTWSDYEGCIARRNWMPFQTEVVYKVLLQTKPFDFVDIRAADTEPESSLPEEGEAGGET